MKPPGEPRQLGHRPALDGLRGCAIALVLLAHSQDRFADSSGAAGVTMFFTLSGFLITCGLLEQVDRAGRVNFRRFWSRRWRRLMPAFLLYVALAALLSLLGVDGFLAQFSFIVATVLYSLNWVIALTGLAPNSLGITWSLAVEEQFYLLWPLTFLVRRWPRFPIYVAVAGVLTAPLLRFLLWDGSAGAARRIYYGTDTRMDGLLLGCLLAYLVRSRLPMPRWSVPAAWAVVAGCALAPMREAFSVLALPTLVPIATCVLIVSCLPATSGWLTSRPMRWLGQRSYGLYLWHYPLLMIAAPELGIPGWSLLPVAFVVAEASYRYVEQPVLRRTGRQTTKSTSAAVAPPLSRA